MQAKSNSSIFTTSLLQALCHKTELAEYFLRKHKINPEDEWISTASMVDCLFHVEEKVGSSTLKRIGANIAHAAPAPAPIKGSFYEFLEVDLNDIYKMNHQQLNAGFSVLPVKGNYLVDLNNNPYPITFNRGLIAGFSFKHQALHNIFEVDKDRIMVERVI
ncbi:hypothetical protein [Peribacillus glennii]|uniref:Uncharacterized protein n=1 Tax=Peribacillus glennii TaxID=2303991 RepID=A0A372L978_9BACI|nr:hypothetical protein [Peribacillus glennii]RFU61616.1 hypothetical protein D0466_17605 [Peribacillus glennii]